MRFINEHPAWYFSMCQKAMDWPARTKDLQVCTNVHTGSMKRRKITISQKWGYIYR
jgi:hypothetical protein